MKEIVFFLEEESAKWLLKGVVPRLLPEEIQVRYVVFNGKTDLHRNLKRKLESWQNIHAKFLIIQDRDSNDCIQLKKLLQKICTSSGKSATIRIACGELESFYLGDLVAVEKGLQIKGLACNQKSKKFRDPDQLGNAAQELIKVTKGEFQKVSGARAIAKYMDLSNNASTSFKLLIMTIRSLFDI